MSAPLPFTLMGMPVYINQNLPQERFIDRAKVRSPARARRRWATGRRKVSPWSLAPPKVYQVGNALVMSPAAYAALQQRLSLPTHFHQPRGPYDG